MVERRDDERNTSSGSLFGGCWSLDLLSTGPPLLPTIRLPSQRFVVFDVLSLPQKQENKP